MPLIDILLPTYNASNFLEGQIASLARQNFRDFRLICRDDVSGDGTGKNLERLAGQAEFEFEILPNCHHTGIVAAMNELLAASNAPYLMFCDQDDVWHPDKIEVTLETMRRTEAAAGADTPVAAFTDLTPTDVALNVLAPSCLKWQHLNPYRTQLNQLLLQNVASGCTMLCNRALADLAAPLPNNAVMHDHWFALTAAALGRLVYLDRATMLYRQHPGNHTGAIPYGSTYITRRLELGIATLRARLLGNIRQGAALLAQFDERLSAPQREMLTAFASIPECSPLERRRRLTRYHIGKNGLMRNLATLLLI